MAVVETRNLIKVFKQGELGAVNNVNLETREGEFLVLLGPSGSGKTTLLRSVAGLEQPSRGKITIGNAVLYDNDAGIEMPVEQRNLGLVFQSYALWPHRSVFDNVAYALRLRGIAASEIGTRVEQALSNLGLGALAKRLPHQLSGGQQQRVAIARALAMHPKVMLFDEPTSSLDPEMVSEVLQVMLNLAQQGMTMVVVTHEIQFANRAADRILFMEDGLIVEGGRPAELMSNPRNKRTQRFLQLVMGEI